METITLILFNANESPNVANDSNHTDNCKKNNKLHILISFDFHSTFINIEPP